MVHATDSIAPQHADIASMKMELMKQDMLNPPLVDLTPLISNLLDLPHSPDVSDDEFSLAFLDHPEQALHDSLFDSSACSSGTSSTIMWSLGRDADPDCALLSSPSSPDSDLPLTEPINFELEVFGLDLPSREDRHTTSAAPSTNAGSSKSTSSVVLPQRSNIRKPVPNPVIILSNNKAGSKRRAEDSNSLEAKKARARQTRDEISAKTQAAMRSLPGSSSSSAAVSPMIISAAGGKLDNPELRRITHNVLERKRREDLKNSYQDLRFQIPELAQNERAPTGQILLKAVEMIEQLKREEQSLLSGLATLRGEQDRLRNRLH